MKGLYALFLLAFALVAAGAAQAGDIAVLGSEDSRTFFPKGWVRGYAEGALAPPHNEVDMNRCVSSTGAVDGFAQAPCSAFARYVMSGYIEIQPLGGRMLGRVFLFWQPHLFLGSNVPQFNYNFSGAPMAYEREQGVGIELPRSLELRLTNHAVHWLGRYNQSLGKADLGPTGPYGLYTTISIRWYFGNLRRPQ